MSENENYSEVAIEALTAIARNDSTIERAQDRIAAAQVLLAFHSHKCYSPGASVTITKS